MNIEEQLKILAEKKNNSYFFKYISYYDVTPEKFVIRLFDEKYLPMYLERIDYEEATKRVQNGETVVVIDHDSQLGQLIKGQSGEV